MFGVSLPSLYASPSAVCPITYANTNTRSSPVIRESAVPVATTRLDRSRELTAGRRNLTHPQHAASCGARLFDRLAQGLQLEDELVHLCPVRVGVGAADAHLGGAGDEPVELR